MLVTQTAKCNVCHVAGQDKKARNAYGKQLSTLLKKENFKAERLKAEPEKVTAEIVAAFDAVAAMKSGDDKSPTFGELIAEWQAARGDAARSGSGHARTDTRADAGRPRPARLLRPPLAPLRPRRRGDRQDSEDRRHRDAAGDERRLAGGRLSPGRHGADRRRPGATSRRCPRSCSWTSRTRRSPTPGWPTWPAIATLERLHLEKTKITDAGLAHLKDLGNLEYLNLYGTAVTDAGLEHLKGLKNLKKLYVWQSQVTDAGIAKLKEALPDVTVVK